MSKSQRQLTVQTHFNTTKCTSKAYPSLKLCGKWLHECGFTPQDKVEITVAKGKLVIKLLK